MLKVIKENEHSLLMNHFGRDGREYLTLSVLTFFDFQRPEEPLREKDMWPFVQDELGEDVILDMGLPKVHAEVLLSAKCFTPNGKPLQGCEVSWSLGPLKKKLYVFGERRWKSVAPRVYAAADPEPFTRMDLTWKNAFGGPAFKDNPQGKGHYGRDAGQSPRVLPNVEYPNALIASVDDKPRPAGFLPLDVMAPQRMARQGTYDDKWLGEDYPHYPKDMDWAFFNTAPEDQWLKDKFFEGKESVYLENLHPEKDKLAFRLPGLRQRCFLLQEEDGTGGEKESKFKEIKTHLDTVWLFPHAERGITIHRGVAQVKDDEHTDVTRIFLASEALEEQPKSLDHYYEEMLVRLDRKVDINTAPLEEAKKKIKLALERISNIGEEIKDGVKQALGQAPALEKKTPAEFAAAAQQRAQKAIEKLSKAEERLKPVKAEFGHLVKIDLSAIKKAKEKLKSAADKAGKAAADLEAAQAKAAEFKEGFKKELKESAQADILADQGVDVDALIDPPVKNPWHETGMKFIYKARKDLESDWEAQEFLKKFGLKPRTVKRAFIGINPAFITQPAGDWGLESGSNGPEVDLPAGLVIPRFEGASLKKLLVVQRPYDHPEAVRLVDGSEDKALDLGMEPGKPVVRVANELEAWLIRQEIGGLAGVIALPDSSFPISDDAADVLGQAPQMLVIENTDRLPQMESSLKNWRKLCPAAEFLPLPKDKTMVAARHDGLDLRNWVLKALKPQFVPDGAIIEEPKPGEHGPPPIVIPDIKALVAEIQDMIKGVISPKVDKAKAKQAEMEGMIAKHLEERGHSLEALKAEAAGAPKPKPFDSGMIKDAFAQARDNLKKTGSLTPEIEKELAAYEGRTSAVADKASARFSKGLAEIEKAENIKPIPDWAKAKLARLGIDPDDQAPLTREEVQRRYAEGLSLSGKNLSGADLSGLDLTGVDLRKANLQGTNLKGAKLGGADLSDVLCQGADFSEAELSSARMVKGVLQKSKFVNANLAGADMTRALLNESDFSSADMTGAVLDKALLEKANLAEAGLKRTSIKRGCFINAEAPGAVFSGADLSKSVFLEAKIPEASFDRAILNKVVFYKTQGGKNTFAGSDLHDARVLQESVFPDSDFSGARAGKGYWRSVDLKNADFNGGRLENVIFEGCDMSSANLSRVKANRARFNKSDLTGAQMKGINLFGGSLRKARLVDADLSDSNLYSVEVLKAVVGGTKLDGANLKMTRIHKYKDLLE